MTIARSDVVIVGAGHGGAQAAIALRQLGYEGSITMVGREEEPPYERPPLSKEYLAREKNFDRLYIRPPHFWADKAIELRLGHSVEAVDPASHLLTLGNGDQLQYGKLIWAAGGDPRRLACSGADLSGVHSVRNRVNVDRMMAELDGGVRQVAIIGGGYIGLEAAAGLTKLGCQVTLLEALPRVLARVAGEALSAFYEREHCARGVDLRTGVTVDSLEGRDGQVSGVRLADGEIVPAGLVIVGIGIQPSIGPLVAAEAQAINGVEVDEYCRTSLPDIYAIGDCAAHRSHYADGVLIRLESVQNATDMAQTAANAIVGNDRPYRSTPWFWSHQYDLKLQTVGLSIGHDDVVMRGDPATRSFTLIYLKQGRIIALDCVNNVKDYVQGKALVADRHVVDADLLADPATPLKSLVS